MPLELLEREIAELAAHINAATCRWLVLVGEFDRREGWADWGCKSCTHWLSYRCGLSPAAAREQVRVARLLTDLRQIRATFERGEICYSQVRALARVATAETERDLLEIARHATAAQLEIVVRAYRGVLSTELGARQPDYERRYVRCEHDDDGSLLISARLPAEEGALILAALEAGRDALRDSRGRSEPDAGSASAETTHIGDMMSAERRTEDGDEAPGERIAVSNADALVMMAETTLAAGPTARTGGDNHQVIVHVDAGTLDRDDDGACRWRTDLRCIPRRPAGWPATRAWSGSWSATGGRSRSDDGPGACRRRCGGPSRAATGYAGSRAAASAASCTPITSSTGPAVDGRS
jgi:hypothetical protein